MENKERYDTVPYQQNDNVLKANSLITAKYRGSLLEAKVLYAALWAVQNKQVQELDDGYAVVLRANELKEITHSSGGSFYESLKPVARSLMHRSVGMENQEEDYFKYINLINECEYDHGEFKIVFAKRSKDLIMDLSKNYTTLPTLMMKFKSVYAFRLYEILKRYCYYRKDVPANKRTNVFSVEKGVAELKLELGTVNAELDTVRRELEDKKFPDFERAVEKSPEELYKTYADFNRYVLKVAVNEINKSSDMYVTYQPKRGGHDRKTYAVCFTMNLNPIQKEENSEINMEELESASDTPALTDTEKFKFHMDVFNLFDQKLPISDIQTISERAGYNYEKIVNANNLMKNQKSKIENVTGWIISCLKDNYENTPYSPSSGGRNKFNNFEQRNYDYEELTKQLVSRPR